MAHIENVPPTPPAAPPAMHASPETSFSKRTSFNATVSFSPTPQPLVPTGEELPPMPFLPRAVSAPYNRASEDLSYLRVQPGCWSPTPHRRKMPERMKRFADSAASPRKSSVDEPERSRRGSKILMPGVDPRKEDQTPWFG
eukprot:CAMPEP_0119070744 /NCGR_PEP_ID=MMETSP1178-20130426/42920_1 /TAXON_ID=33656 /ORGANISM="unid sp, Strain CCMP2000" /LENGTH=140 /DNA_ID=CAMNT_0007052609 /DNA_START=39 /DNA_END=461 /DNA_ORIENTATION=-